MGNQKKNGLSNSQKSSIHSLLNLPLPRDLDQVLACLRSLIRNCVLKSLEGDDSLKILPADLPLELQSMFLVLLQKHQSYWKEEESLEPHASGWTRSSHQGILNDVAEGQALYIPGATTPTEILSASNDGAKIIKVYPVSALGGVKYLAAVKKPFPHIPLVASQGITLDSVGVYIGEGASAVVLSDAIFDKEAMAQRNFCSNISVGLLCSNSGE